MKVRTSTGRMVLVVLAVLLGASSGVGALLVAAALTRRPPLFLLAGLAGFCAVYLLGRPLPEHPYEGTDRPEGYEGPP